MAFEYCAKWTVIVAGIFSASVFLTCSVVSSDKCPSLGVGEFFTQLPGVSTVLAPLYWVPEKLLVNFIGTKFINQMDKIVVQLLWILGISFIIGSIIGVVQYICKSFIDTINFFLVSGLRILYVLMIVAAICYTCYNKWPLTHLMKWFPQIAQIGQLPGVAAV